MRFSWSYSNIYSLALVYLYLLTYLAHVYNQGAICAAEAGEPVAGSALLARLQPSAGARLRRAGHPL
jgi:hypothetical protein